MKRNYPLTLFAWCFVVLVASFLPWGTLAYLIFPSRSAISENATGWTGSIVMLGMIIPNWIVVVMSATLAFIGWLQFSGHPVNPRLSLWLAGYGVFHTLMYVLGILSLTGNPTASPAVGIGTIVTIIAFFGIILTLEVPIVKEIRESMSVFRSGQNTS